MAAAAQLFQLEQFDTAITTREGELREVLRAQRSDPVLAAAEAKLDALRAQEDAAAAEQRLLEANLAELERRIQRGQTRMYSGQIVDTRELSSLEHELEHLRGQRDTLEERTLEIMEQRDELQRALQEESRRANELRERREGDLPLLARQQEELTDAIAALRNERDQLASSLEPRSLNVYQRLRASSGYAVSLITQGVCQRCRVVIPPKDIQHTHAGSLVMCPNCGRILHAGG